VALKSSAQQSDVGALRGQMDQVYRDVGDCVTRSEMEALLDRSVVFLVTYFCLLTSALKLFPKIPLLPLVAVRPNTPPFVGRILTIPSLTHRKVDTSELEVTVANKADRPAMNSSLSKLEGTFVIVCLLYDNRHSQPQF